MDLKEIAQIVGLGAILALLCSGSTAHADAALGIDEPTLQKQRVFSPDPQIGTIESGKLADLLILDADPLVDIGNARQINKVIKGGHVFEVNKLKTQ